MTFLKKLGSIIANIAGVALGVGPLMSPFLGSKGKEVVGTAVSDLTAIGSVITGVEAIFQTPGSGPSKLKAAIPLVANIVKTSELVSGKKVADEALFTKACEEYARATVDLLNSIHPDNAKHL